MNPQLLKLLEMLKNDEYVKSSDFVDAFIVLADVVEALKQKYSSMHSEAVDELADAVRTLRENFEKTMNDKVNPLCTTKEFLAYQQIVKEKLQDIKDSINTIELTPGEKGDTPEITEELKEEIAESALALFKKENPIPAPEEWIKMINALPTDKEEFKIDAKHIKGMPQMFVPQPMPSGGFSTPIETVIKAGANIVVTKDASGAWVITGTGGSGGIAWGAITGSLSDQTDLQAALDAKQGALTLTTTGSSGAATLVGNTLNIPQYSGGAGGVSSIASADGSITVTNPTTTADLAVVKAPKWSTARLLANNSVDGSANVAFANKFIVQGTSDTGLSGAQFLGSLATGILKSTTTTGVLSIAVAGDFPTLNQNTTGTAANLSGTPALPNGTTATTQSPNDNSTKIATTAYTDAAVIAGTVGLLDYRGSYDASTNLFPATGGSGIAGAVLKGDFWITSVGGTLGGVVVTPGDLIIAIVDTPAQTAANWDLIPHNLGSYVTSVSGTSNRITSTGGATPVIDISASYVGQSSITTLGTITTGVWNGTAIANANLANSSVTIGSTSVALGATAATIAGLTLTTPVINGTITGTGQATAATASTIAMRDSNANITANNWLGGYTTTATAAGTTTLTVGSTFNQYFTGSTTQTVTLPVTSTLTLGHQFIITNNSTGAVTVNSSGANAVLILAAGTWATFTCILTSGTSAASWSASYNGIVVTTAKKLSVSNSLTLAGTDSTTMTFPTTSKTIAANDGSNWTFASQAIGELHYATSTTAYGRLAAVALGSVLTSAGTGTAPTWSSAPQITSIELGHATDTTLARVSAGVVSIEGVNILTTATGLALSGGTMTGSITLAENAGLALDPAGSADGKWTGITMTATAGATVAFGDLVYLDAATSRWKLADADASSTAGPVHMAMCLGSSTDGNSVTLLLQGNIRADAKFPALTIGASVYVGETAGAVQVAIPTGADNVIRVVGFALTADEIYFNPSQDHQITVA